MSASHIDTLLDLWAATLIKHNDAPPFATHDDLYSTIDATPLGDVPWESFSMTYTGDKPAEDVPPWMDSTYDVWFRDPHLLVQNLLSNPDFDGEMEYIPYRDYMCYDSAKAGTRDKSRDEDLSQKDKDMNEVKSKDL